MTSSFKKKDPITGLALKTKLFVEVPENSQAESLC